MSTVAAPTQAPAGAVARGLPAWWQAAPFSAVFALFFVLPLLLVLMVSF